MKILYGVQATGNGHITRARAMNKAFKEQSINVDYLFTGRAKDKLFDMEEFGDFNCLPGLTFITDAGSIKPIATMQHNSLRATYQDIKQLDLSAYDLVLTDFEPISAWAARKQKVNSIAVGHQYAFAHSIPKRGNNPLTSLFMQYFAPADIQLGLHWHHFYQPILPPIADTHEHLEIGTIDNKILVYLGFENPEDVIKFLEPLKNYQFFIYAPFEKAEDRDHLKLRPLSRESFQKDLCSCNGVISNAGFELASEAIHLGKKLLMKPLKGQMEQLSNALAIEQLKLGMCMDSLDRTSLQHWLTNFSGKRIIYPNVPDALVKWIINGNWDKTDQLVNELWSSVHSPDFENFSALGNKR